MADIKTKATAKKVSRGGANTLSLNKPSTDDNGSVVLPKAESVSQVRADFNSFVNDELKKKYAAQSDRYSTEIHDAVRRNGITTIVPRGTITTTKGLRVGADAAKRTIDRARFSDPIAYTSQWAIDKLARGLQNLPSVNDPLGTGAIARQAQDAGIASPVKDRSVSSFLTNAINRSGELNNYNAITAANYRLHDYESQLKARESGDLAQKASLSGNFSSGSRYNANLYNDKDYDLVYEQINNSRRYQNWLNSTDGANGWVPNGNGGSYLEYRPEYSQLTEEEKSVYNYYYNQGDKEAANAYLEGIRSDLQRRRAETNVANYQAYGAEHPIAGTAGAVAMSPIGGLGAIPAAAEALFTGKVNPYASYNQILEMRQGLKGGAKETIVDDITKIYGKSAGEAAGFLYDAGTSWIESMTRAVTNAAIPGLGFAGLLSMSLEAGQAGMNEYAQNGASGSEALALGVINGLAEYITENMQMERITGFIKSGTPEAKKTIVTWFRDLVLNSIKESIPEAAEEAVSAMVDKTAEMMILGVDRSAWGKRVEELMSGENPMSREDAEKQATLEQWKEIGLEAAAGAVSGALGAQFGTNINYGISASIKGAESAMNRSADRIQRRADREAAKISSEVENASAMSAEQWEASRKDQSAEAVRRRQTIRDTGERHGVGENTIRELQAASDRTGRNVAFTILPYSESASMNGVFDDDGNVLVNAKSNKPLHWILLHEFGHSIENSKEFNSLARLAVRHMYENGIDVEREIQKRAILYAKNGATNANPAYEMIMDWFGSNMGDSVKDIERLCNYDHGLGIRAWNYINEQLSRALGSGDQHQAAILNRAKEMYGRALSETAPSARRAWNTTEEPEYVAPAAEETEQKTAPKERTPEEIDEEYENNIGDIITEYAARRMTDEQYQSAIDELEQKYGYKAEFAGDLAKAKRKDDAYQKEVDKAIDDYNENKIDQEGFNKAIDQLEEKYGYKATELRPRKAAETEQAPAAQETPKTQEASAKAEAPAEQAPAAKAETKTEEKAPTKRQITPQAGPPTAEMKMAKSSEPESYRQERASLGEQLRNGDIDAEEYGDRTDRLDDEYGRDVVADAEDAAAAYNVDENGEYSISQNAENERKENEFMQAGDTPVIRYSITTGLEPLGLGYKKGENGETYFIDHNGNNVENITADMIWNSGYGAIIRASTKTVGNPDGVLTSDEAKAEVQFWADTLNLMLKTQDIDLIWAVNSTIGFQPIQPGEVYYAEKSKSKFSALTANADYQYTTTIDFTTICKKTQAVIDVMSDIMKRKGKGLTSKEVVNIVYDEVAKAGEPVPCPVCYVFSRWVGLGGLFDNINNMQSQYPVGMDTSEIQKDVDALRKTINGFAKGSFGDRKNAYYKAIVKEQDNLAYKQFVAENGNGEPLTETERDRLATLTKQIKYIDQWTWLTDVRLKKNYKPVPPDILFDINAGKTFAENYPTTWKYRTSRGPSMGKAATPYAEEHLGQIIRGIATPSAVGKHQLGDLSRDPFLDNDGELSNTAKTTIKKAKENARKQNLLNGERIQSTSDFRYEYALDYLMAYFELQTVASKAQGYTKVPEMVSMNASCNVETNCSLMPLNDGYDENDNLIFSDVTGMNAEDAFRYSAMYDCVQPIIVGINPKHVRLCMRDPRLTFCIPFHSSGGTEDNYVSMMRSVEETVTDRTDFSHYQNDTKNDKATPEQKAAYSARMKILTGKASDITDAEKRAVRNNEILSQLYIRFYGEDVDGNVAKVDDIYLNPSDRGKGRDSETYHTFLSKKQAEKVMPYEFWDKSATISTKIGEDGYINFGDDDINGARFVNYCESIGLHPRFSGWSDAGGYDPEMNFTDEAGYWIVIPDRAMYNNDGTYHVQQPVNISNFEAEYLQPAGADKAIVKPSKSNNRSKVREISDRAIVRISADRAARGEKFSYTSNVTPEEDERYMEAARAGDEDRAESMVYMAAKRAGAAVDENGNVIDLYHGTPRFGFDTFEMDTGTNSYGIIYTTTRNEVSANYGGGGRGNYAFVRKLGKGFKEYATDINDIIDNAYTVDDVKYQVLKDSDRKSYIRKLALKANDILQRLDIAYPSDDVLKWDDEDRSFENAFNGIYTIFGDLMLRNFRNNAAGGMDLDEENLAGLHYALDSREEFNYEKAEYEYLSPYDKWIKTVQDYLSEHRDEIEKTDKEFYDLYSGYDLTDEVANIRFQLLPMLDGGDLLVRNGEKVGTIDAHFVDPQKLQARMDENHNSGVYHLFGFLGDKPLIVDANAKSWFQLKAPEVMGDDREYTTDAIAHKAKDLGYTSVIVKNVYDGGMMADNYMFFDPSQVKSADPITYDDNGEIIPLDERFNQENDDIRYSITPAENAEYMKAAEAGDEETAGRMVEEAANRAFPKSKVRSDDGRLKRMFHGTNANVEYTVFDIDKTKNGLYGKGFYFTDNAKIANEYTEKENGKKPRVYSAYLDIKNPLIMEDDADAAKWLMALPELRDYVWDEDSEELKVKTNHEFYRAAQKYFEDNGYDKEDFGWDMLELLENMGYDGINHIGGKFRKSSSVKHNVWIAFRPEQIKSADPITYDDDDEIIPLDERFNQENDDIRYSITPAENAEYMKAAEAGDEETAGRMVEEAARRAGYKYRGYHGTSRKFTTFKPGKATGWGEGIYFASNEEDAREYGDNIVAAYLKMDKPYTGEPIKAENTQAYKKYVADYYKNIARDEGITVEEAMEDMPKPTVTDMVSDENVNYLNAALRELGYDGIMVDGSNDITGTEMVVFNPNQAKSADPIVYDDNGEIIPLGERFNPENDDIRYSYTENEPQPEQDTKLRPMTAVEQADRRLRNAQFNAKVSERQAAADNIRLTAAERREMFGSPNSIGKVNTYATAKVAEAEGRGKQIIANSRDIGRAYENVGRAKGAEHEREGRESKLKLERAGRENKKQLEKEGRAEKRRIIKEGAPALDQMAKEKYAKAKERGYAAGYESGTKKANREYTQLVKQYEREMIEAEDRENAHVQLWEKARNQEYKPIESAADAVDMYNALKAARRAYRRISDYNELTPRERMFVGRLLRGEEDAATLFREKDIRYLKVLSEATAVYNYSKLGSMLGEYRGKIHTEANKTALDAIGGSENFRKMRDVPQKLLASAMTTGRVFDYIAGNDYEMAERLKDAYVKPITRSNGAEERLKQRIKDRISALNIDKSIRKGNKVSEDYAVQFIGEKMSEIEALEDKESKWRKQHDSTISDIRSQLDGGVQKNGRPLTEKMRQNLEERLNNHESKEMPEYKNEAGQTLEELRAEVEAFKNANRNLDYNRIENDLVPVFREIYNDLFEKMNEARVANGYEPVDYRRGYFPHFTREDTSAMVRFAKSLGMEFDNKVLPTSIQGLTHEFRPGINWFSAAQERTGTNTDFSAQEGMDRYLEGVAKVIYRTENITKMRALANTIRRLADPKFDRFIKDVYSDKTKSEEEKYAAVEQKWRNELSDDKKAQRQALSYFVTWLDERTNIYAGKATNFDRLLRENLQVRTDKGLWKLLGFATDLPRGMVTRYGGNTVSINPGSWLTNFAPIFEVSAEVNPKYVLQALGSLKKDLREGFTEESNFLTARSGTDPLFTIADIGKTQMNHQGALKWLEGLGNVMKGAVNWGAKPMELIDGVTSYVVTRAYYLSNLDKGMSHDAALDLADNQAGDLMADRAPGKLPILMEIKNPIAKGFTQFQTEVLNSLEHNTHDVFGEIRKRYADDPKRGRAVIKSILRYMGFALRKSILLWLCNELYEALVGRRFMPDPIDWANEFRGDLTGSQLPNTVNLGINAGLAAASGGKVGRLPTAEDFMVKAEPNKAVANLGKNVAEELPIVGSMLGGGRIPVQQAVKDIDKLPKGIALLTDDDKENNSVGWRNLVKGLSGPLTYFVLPGGGTAIRRAVQAAEQYVQGGAFDVNGNLRYPLYNDNTLELVTNVAKVGLFGSTSSEAGQKWVDSGFDSFSKDATAAYIALTELGIDRRKAYGVVNKMRDVTKSEDESENTRRRAFIREQDIDGRAKAALYETMVLPDTAKARDVIDTLDIMGADMDKAMDLILGLADIDAKGYTVPDDSSKAAEKRKLLNSSRLDGDSKLEVYSNLILTSNAAKERDLISRVREFCDDGELVKVLTGLKESGKTVDDTRVLVESSLPDDVKEEVYKTMCVNADQVEKKESQIDAFREAGMGFNEYITAANKYAEINAQEDLKPVQKATEFARWADDNLGSGSSAAKENLKYSSGFSVEASGYEKMTDTGLSSDKAYDLTNQLAALTPKEGKTTVSDVQKAQVVASQADLSEEEKLKALRAVYSDSENSTYSKAYVANMYGVPLEDYFKIVDKCLEVDADPKYKDYKAQERTAAVLNSFKSLTNKQRAAIWQVYNTGWVAKNNPYDSSVGAYVRSLYYESDGKTKKETLPGGLSRSGSSSTSAELTPPKATVPGGTSSSGSGQKVAYTPKLGVPRG